MQRYLLIACCALSFPFDDSTHASAASLNGLPSNYVPGSPLSFVVRLPALSDLGAYNVDVVVQSTEGTAGVDFYFDAAATAPAATNYIFPSATNFFDAANVDSNVRHRITLTDFDLVGVNVASGINDLVANVVLQTTATFSGALSLYVDAGGLILDTPAETPTPVAGFDAIQAGVAGTQAIVLQPVPEPTSIALVFFAAILWPRWRCIMSQ